MWSYTLSGLATEEKDQVRLLVHDTDPADPLLEDEEINALIAFEGRSPVRVAWRAALAIAARYSRDADKTMGPLHVTSSQKSQQYTALACDLKAKMLRSGPVFYLAAQSRSDKHAVENEEDRVAPAFTRDIFLATVTDLVNQDDEAELIP